MQPAKRKKLMTIGALILTTLAIMGLSGQADSWMARPPGDGPPDAAVRGDGLRVTGTLVQDKVLRGASGHVGLALSLTAPESGPLSASAPANVDLVVVLDRSGSMNGTKINDARRAVLRLMDSLAPEDRLALVSYADNVVTHAGLTPMTAVNRRALRAAVGDVKANGGTNLGAGLKRGITLAGRTAPSANARRVILISDGLANQGITDPPTLGAMAAGGTESALAISTVGVGQEFNEHLMAHLADKGGGSYYDLEHPAAFAAVFQEEYQQARAVAAASMRVELVLPEGGRLVNAGGYPVRQTGTHAVFHPGSLRYGQARKLHLTLKLPTDTPRRFELGDVRVHYHWGEQVQTAVLAERFTVACVDDADDVVASIRKEAWSDQVVREDFGRLKEEVAADIKGGREAQALRRIQTYRQEKKAINAVVGSARVTENLAREVDALSTYVQETFAGPAPAVAAKQKKNAKALQYDGYRERRDK